jgi:endoglucanase
VCYWEDDRVQFEDPTYEGGANGVSLRDGRLNYLDFGASDVKSISFVRWPLPDEMDKGSTETELDDKLLREARMDFSHLKSLVELYGPSGDEFLVADYIQATIAPYVDEVWVDKMGNVLAHKKGEGPKVLVAAHMDQIGFMVTDIDDKGFLRVTSVGGINPYISHGSRVVFRGGFQGILYAEQSVDTAKMELKHLYVDIDATDKEEVKKKVQIGDTCVYACFYNETERSITSGAMDDRIGCFVMMEALKELDQVGNDCYFAFTVQEEVGTRGGKMVAYAVNPDVGLAVDITGSGDTPGSNRFAVGLHKGVAIKVRDNSLLSHPKVNAHLKACCEAKELPYQMEVLEFGGTDAGAISLTREGIPSSCISIPTRYVHGPHETLSKSDVEGAVVLLREALRKAFVVG